MYSILITPSLSCCRKRERGTSGRWRQSAPDPCWAGLDTEERPETLSRLSPPLTVTVARPST
ncbi:MAG: hypothetical protein ACFFC7_33785, partial [Candidatus Hermodarchaeota archaeon]